MAVWSEINSSEATTTLRFDPEYYRPERIWAGDVAECFSNKTKLVYICDKITQGSNPKFSETGIPCLNGRNIYFGSSSDNEPNYVSEEEYCRLQSFQLIENDIVITLKHATKIGRVWAIESNDPLIFSRNVGLIRLNKYQKVTMPSILFYLWSTIGQLQLDRFATGGTSGQITLPISYLKKMWIPVFSNVDQQKIESIYREYLVLKNNSHSLYTQAEKLLEQELGLDKIEFENPISHEASFSEVLTNNRSDSEYFQIKFRQLEEHISKINTLRLSDIFSLLKGFEVGSKAYKDNGKLFIRVSNLTPHGVVTTGSDKFVAKHLYDSLKLFKPNQGDILLTKDGTIGMCYVVDCEIEGIICGGILKLQTLNSDIPKEYLALAINSKFCQMQAHRDCSGALILHWKPGDIRKLRIPILKDSIMRNLADIVTKAKAAKKQSQQLLDQAKQQVEELIEQGVN